MADEIKYEDIPDSVFEGMEEVRKSGICNILDKQTVFVELFNLGYYEAVRWLFDSKWTEGSYRSQCDNKKYVAVLHNWGMPERIINKLIGD